MENGKSTYPTNNDHLLWLYQQLKQLLYHCCWTATCQYLQADSENVQQPVLELEFGNMF